MAHEEEAIKVQKQDSAVEALVVPEVSSPANKDSVSEKVTIFGENTKPKASEKENISELSEARKKALEELKKLVQEALEKQEFNDSVPKTEHQKTEQAKTEETKTEQAKTEQAKTEHEDAKKTIGSCIEKDDNNSDDPSVESDQESQSEDEAKTVEAIAETVIPKAKTESSPVSPDTKQQRVSIWGINLMEDERTDTILLKFLEARDYKPKESFTMLKNTNRWRKQFGIDELIEQGIETGDEWEKVVFMKGQSKEGHPVCYNVYGHFQNRDLYRKTFSDEEKRQRFLRWRIQFLEKSIRKLLDFSPGGVCSIVQVNDLSNSPGPAKWELRQATKQALHLLQDNYPEFLAKQVFINVPWWYLAVSRMTSPFLTQRTKSKFVFAGPSKSAETLFKYIAAEQVPIQYGGLSKDGEFGTADSVTEITVRPSAKHIVEFPVNQSCILTWEMRVVGWEVSYGAEFVPNAEDRYTVIIQKLRKFSNNNENEDCEDEIVCNSYKISEPGKVVLTIDNHTSKKKKLLYRLKAKPSLD